MKTKSRIQMEDFKNALNQEIALYNSIERLLDQKRELIMQGDLETLVKIDNELEQLSQRARSLEQERLAIMVRMGRQGDTLREFIESLESGEDTQMLVHAREQLVKSVESIKNLSKTNRDLLTQSIRFIEQSISVIASILSPENPSYSDLRVNKGNQSDSTSTQNTLGISSTIIRDA